MLSDKEIKFLKANVKRKWISIFLFVFAANYLVVGALNLSSVNKMRKAAELSWSDAIDLSDLPSFDRNYLPEEVFIGITIRKAFSDFMMSIFLIIFGALYWSHIKYYTILLKYYEMTKT